MRHHTECRVEALEVEDPPQSLEGAESLLLAVTGMGCPGCAVRVHNQLLRTDGVLAAELDHESVLVRVWHDPGRITPYALCRAVARAGDGTHHDYWAVPVRSRLG